MKRLILSVLMLMAATLIFSQANQEKEEPEFPNDIVQNEQNILDVN